MESDYFSSVLSLLPKEVIIITIFAIAVCVFVGIFCIKYRSRSFFTIWDFFWNLFAGKKSFNNPYLNNFYEENKDIYRLSFIYNLRIQTISEARKIISFCKNYNLNIRNYNKISKFLLLDEKEIIIKIDKNYVIKKKIGVGFVFFFVVLFFILILYGGSLFHMRSSGVWFTMNGPVISKFFSINNSVNISACGIDRNSASNVVIALHKKIGFSMNEAQIVCQSYKDQSLLPLAHKTLIGQRIMLLVPLLCSIFLLFKLCFDIDNGQLAVRLDKRKNSNQVKT